MGCSTEPCVKNVEKLPPFSPIRAFVSHKIYSNMLPECAFGPLMLTNYTLKVLVLCLHTSESFMKAGGKKARAAIIFIFCD